MNRSITFDSMEIKVTAKRWSEPPIYLREGIGEGELQDGRKFTVDATIPGHSLLIKVDGIAYEVALKDIIAGLAEAITDGDDSHATL